MLCACASGYNSALTRYPWKMRRTNLPSLTDVVRRSYNLICFLHKHRVLRLAQMSLWLALCTGFHERNDCIAAVRFLSFYPLLCMYSICGKYMDSE